MKEEVRQGVIYDDLLKVYEVRYKMHIKTSSVERATELGLLFVHPSIEKMKKYGISCCIRDTFVQKCTPITPAQGEHADQIDHARRQHASFYGQECPIVKEEPNGDTEEDDDIPI